MPTLTQVFSCKFCKTPVATSFKLKEKFKNALKTKQNTKSKLF